MSFDLLHLEFDSTTAWIAIGNLPYRRNRALLGLMVMRFAKQRRITISLQILYFTIEWDNETGFSYE